ncbi:hypothetical protein FRX31_034529, partial [Thalictrum thalictroides]
MAVPSSHPTSAKPVTSVRQIDPSSSGVLGRTGWRRTLDGVRLVEEDTYHSDSAKTCAHVKRAHIRKRIGTRKDISYRKHVGKIYE